MTLIKDICGKYFLHCKLLKTLHIFSFIYSQRAHYVYTTSAQRRCNVMTLHHVEATLYYVMCLLGWFSIFFFFLIKMIRHRAVFSLQSDQEITPPSTVFPICANNSDDGLYDKNSIHLTYNFKIFDKNNTGNDIDTHLLLICQDEIEICNTNFRHFLKILKVNPFLFTDNYSTGNLIKTRFILWRRLSYNRKLKEKCG